VTQLPIERKQKVFKSTAELV